MEQPLLLEYGYVDQGEWLRAVANARLGRCDSIKHFKAAATLELWLVSAPTTAPRWPAPARPLGYGLSTATCSPTLVHSG
jgi:hypothetical protein